MGRASIPSARAQARCSGGSSSAGWPGAPGRWTSHPSLGSLPGRKTSSSEAGQCGPARFPESGQTAAWASRVRSTSDAGERPAMARTITRAKIGPAPVIPETPCIGRPSKDPTQTATVRSAVNPAVQLST